MIRKHHILKWTLGVVLGITLSATYSVRSAHAQTPFSVTLVGNSQLVSPLSSSKSFSSLSHPVIFSKIKQVSKITKKSKPSAKVSQAPSVVTDNQMQTTETSILSPTITQTPSPTDTPTTTPTSTPTEPASGGPGGLNADVLFGLVNAHRQSIGLAPFAKNDLTCNEANSRITSVGTEITTGHMHAGFWGNPHIGVSTENIIDMNTEQAALNWWLNDYIHRIAVEGNYLYSCVACSGNFCTEEFGN